MEFLRFPAPAPAEEKNGCLIRVDSGVRTGNEIGIYYDPMIAKIIAYSPNSRAEAVKLLHRALSDTVIFGVKTNRSFLREICKTADFLSGNTTTHFIAKNFPAGFSETEILLRNLMHREDIKIALGVNMLLHRDGGRVQLPVAPLSDERIRKTDTAGFSK